MSFITEIWEQDENKKHQKKVEKLLELKGIKYISKPRRNRLGGGAAIAVNLKSYSLSKLNVHVPTNVECVWGLAKPLKPNKSYSSFICCSFYSPPASNIAASSFKQRAVKCFNSVPLCVRTGSLATVKRKN